MTKRKQVLLFLVEGYTDKITLELAMTKLIDQENVEFVITDGDLTSNYTISLDSIVKNIGTRVKEAADRYHFQHKDFYKVIHLIDTDAAFISPEKVLDMQENSMLLQEEFNLYYDPQMGIWAKNPESIRKRNQFKQSKVKRLQSLKNVWKGIPYEIYYMSMNLEHVLYNRPNVSDKDKVKLANKKETDLYKNPGQLAEFFLRPEIALGGETYEESWEFIQRENNSLKRCSNFNVFFRKSEREEILKI